MLLLFNVVINVEYTDDRCYTFNFFIENKLILNTFGYLLFITVGVCHYEPRELYFQQTLYCKFKIGKYQTIVLTNIL